jgi:hypothetical protein
MWYRPVTPVFYNIGVSMIHKKIRGKLNKSVGLFFRELLLFSRNRPCIIDTLIFQISGATDLQVCRKSKSHNRLRQQLQRQFRAFQNDDMREKQQKALPFSVLNELAKQQIVTETDKTIVLLSIGAAFFAMRSCEYSQVPRREQKRTKLLCLRNI